MDWKLILCMGLAAAGLLFGLSQWLRARRQLERMDRMLDRAIDGSFLESSFDESVPSALESKMSRFLNGSARPRPPSPICCCTPPCWRRAS